MTKDNSPDTNGWSRAELYVMQQLSDAKEDRKALENKIDALTETVTELRVDVARKGAIWGAISGAVVGVVMALLRR